MGRAPRVDVAGHCYHILNRANHRETVFHKDGDYEAFEAILAEAVARSDVDLLAYCLMPNHWHMVVRPNVDGEMSRFCQWLTLTHTQRYNAHYEITGHGHLYQGRYKSFPIQDDDHFLTVCRYVERNAFTAQLCESPENWRWGSLFRWKYGSTKEKTLLGSWPIARRPKWSEWVRMELSERELKKLRWSVERGAPYGDEGWTESIARRYNLEMTMRPRGRPKKFAGNKTEIT
ncbi:transposase [Rhodopirellula sp. MGV]|uniref:transposase n=1 Tax=Rhodopirellula sp. MGV TaxID=2023130 RepID=UPI0018E98550|nr:transposase [Rhodopirellula sp. MGV]